MNVTFLKVAIVAQKLLDDDKYKQTHYVSIDREMISTGKKSITCQDTHT